MIPANHSAAAAGHPDSAEAALAYLSAGGGETVRRPLLEAFVDRARRCCSSSSGTRRSPSSWRTTPTTTPSFQVRGRSVDRCFRHPSILRCSGTGRSACGSSTFPSMSPSCSAASTRRRPASRRQRSGGHAGRALVGALLRGCLDHGVRVVTGVRGAAAPHRRRGRHRCLGVERNGRMGVPRREGRRARVRRLRVGPRSRHTVLPCVRAGAGDSRCRRGRSPDGDGDGRGPRRDGRSLVVADDPSARRALRRSYPFAHGREPALLPAVLRGERIGRRFTKRRRATTTSGATSWQSTRNGRVPRTARRGSCSTPCTGGPTARVRGPGRPRPGLARTLPRFWALAGHHGIDPDGLDTTVAAFNQYRGRAKTPSSTAARAYALSKGDRSQDGVFRTLGPVETLPSTRWSSTRERLAPVAAPSRTRVAACWMCGTHPSPGCSPAATSPRRQPGCSIPAPAGRSVPRSRSAISRAELPRRRAT